MFTLWTPLGHGLYGFYLFSLEGLVPLLYIVSVLCRGDGKDFCLFSFIFVSSFGYFQTWNWNSGQFDRCWLTVFHVTSSILVAFLKPEIQIGLKSVFACVLTFHLSAKSSNASLSQLHNENKTTPTSLWDNITDRLLYSCNVVVINYSPFYSLSALPICSMRFFFSLVLHMRSYGIFLSLSELFHSA